MSFLANITKEGVTGIVGAVGGIIDQFHTSDEEKNAMMLKVEDAVTKRLQVIEETIQARFKMVTSIIQSDNATGDKFTSRARPAVVYFGLVVIALNHVILPWAAYFAGPVVEGATPLPNITLPEEFWWAWTGVVGLWVVGRSAEKSGIANRAVSALTGSKKNGGSGREFNLEL